MSQFNSSHTKATSFGDGMLQVMRTMATSVATITAVLVLAGIVFGLTGCSKDKDQNKNENISASQAIPTPTISLPAPVNVAKPVVAKKRRTANKRPSTVTYISSAYGVSFQFPGQYDLTTPGTGDQSALAEHVPSNFVQPGGVPVATIELPGDWSTSFFSVSANKLLTSQECQQFAIPAQSDPAGNLSVDGNDSSIPSKTSIHGLEFTKVENASEQEDVQYYHHFEPGSDGSSGTCYEFAMGVEQGHVSSKTLNYPELFDKLEKVMATVQIKPEEGSTAAVTLPGHEASGTTSQQ